MPIEEETWEALVALAREAMAHAYAPYSSYPVGAAILTVDGRSYSGCNVENAALGVTLCAECGAISSLIRDGGGRIAAFVCVNGAGELIVPCGRCRQLLWEHGGAEMRLLLPGGVYTGSDLLPAAFDTGDLDAVAGPRTLTPEQD